MLSRPECSGWYTNVEEPILCAEAELTPVGPGITAIYLRRLSVFQICQFSVTDGSQSFSTSAPRQSHLKEQSSTRAGGVVHTRRGC